MEHKNVHDYVLLVQNDRAIGTIDFASPLNSSTPWIRPDDKVLILTQTHGMLDL